MKSRLLWIAILAIGATALYFGISQPPISTLPKEVRDPLADLRPAAPPPLEMPALEIPPLPIIRPPVLPAATARFDPVPPKPEVPIQNAATIDFSTGYPHVRVHGKDQEALDAAIKEIAEATKGVTFEAMKDPSQKQ
jgi:hypothetical protein